MNRLTKRVDGIAVLESWAIDKDPVSIIQMLCNRLAAYEDTGVEPEDLKRAFNETASLKLAAQALRTTPDHLHDLLQAEQDGRLVVLPCKVGDTVYQVDYMTHSEALKSGIPQSKDPYQNRKYGRKRAEYLPLIVREKKMVKSLFRDFGKTVFLTRQEAEAALKGGEG